MPSPITEKLKSVIDKKWFTTLVDQTDFDVYENDLTEYILPNYSDIRIELAKNFSTGKKWYGIHFPGAPINLGGLLSSEDVLLEIRNYILFFEDDLSSPSKEVIIHTPFVIENSFDDSQKVRETFKEMLNKFYSYEEEFITKAFNVFDGFNINYVESINIDRKNALNSFSCYEVNDYDLPFESSRDLTRNKDVIQRLGEIYGINSSPLDNLITKLEPIIGDENVRLTYSLNQNETGTPGVFAITLTPHLSTEDYTGTISNMCDKFNDVGMMSIEESNDLKGWTNFEDRIVTGFSLQIKNKGKGLDLSFCGHYGFVPTIVEPEPMTFEN